MKEGWETLFNTDLDKNAILEGGSAESGALTLFSSSKGAVTIKEGSNVDGEVVKEAVTDVNVLAATPAKADFNTFSTSSSTYQVLVEVQVRMLVNIEVDSRRMVLSPTRMKHVYRCRSGAAGWKTP